MPHEPGHIVDPDQFRNLLANIVVDDFLAQQDATDTEQINKDFEAGTGADFLRSLFGVALDFTPGVGDVKAAGFDAPRQFGEGQNVAGIISLLSAIPGIGILGDIIRASTKGAGGAAADVLRSTTGARADALQPLRRGTGGGENVGGPAIDILDDLAAGGRSGGEDAGQAAAAEFRQRVSGGERLGPQRSGTSRSEIARIGDEDIRLAQEARSLRQADDVRAIREQIFKDLVRPDPFGEREQIHEGVIEQIQRLLQNRINPGN